MKNNMASDRHKTNYRYVAYVSEHYQKRGTGYIYGNTLKEVRKAVLQKAKTVRWHKRMYFGGLHPQHVGGIWKLGWRPINFTDKMWAEVGHVGLLVYDTGSNRLLQGNEPSSPTKATTKWRVVRADGSLSDYVDFSLNLL